MTGKTTKIVAAAIVMAVALTPVTDAGAKKKKRKKPKPPEPIVRVDSFDYSAPAGVRAQGNDGTLCVEGNGCTTFMAAAGELYVTIDVSDETGTPTPILVTIGDAKTEYCGTTGAPVPLDGATEVTVAVEAAIPGKCQAVGTSGTVTATFTDLPVLPETSE
ncbi:MAG: hypothetical protein ACRDLB_04645 [Actinomycetota bacterium]